MSSPWVSAFPRFILALALLPVLSVAQASAPANPQADSGAISPAQYQARLQSLEQLVASCKKAPSPANCQGEQVGSDLKVAFPSGTRQVRLAWLHELMSEAATGHAPKPESVKIPGFPEQKPDFAPPTLAQQLEDARQRLVSEEQAAAQPMASAAANQPTDTTAQRQTLTNILAAKEYHAAVARPTLLHRILEKVDNWLVRFFANLRKAGFKSRWIGLTAEIVFGLLVCIALVWFLIRLERNGRLATGFHPEAASGAASARDWQLWLEDAQKAASEAAWRDAIHYLYWASISRLESSGLWPADRARTPREYLALLSNTSTERTGLTALTRSFERTWYAGRPAAQSDFVAAEQMAAQLGAKSAIAPSRPSSAETQEPR